ncbi:MAG: hypothetical protein AAB343_00775 [Patescibacteria group bacterium]
MRPYTRKFFFWIAYIFILIIATVTLLYSFGYRYANGNIVLTGGLFIYATPSSDVAIYLDNTYIETSSIINRTTFIQSLTPGTYTIRAEHSGFQTWQKTLDVSPELVTEVRPVLVHDTPSLDILIRGEFTDMQPWNTTAIALTKKGNITQYFNVNTGEFVASALVAASSTPIVIDEELKTLITFTTKAVVVVDAQQQNFAWFENGVVFVSRDPRAPIPFYGSQRTESVYTPRYRVDQIAFYPRRDALIITEGYQIVIIELDGRGGHIVTPLYKGKDPKIVIPDPARRDMYIFDDGALIHLELN